MFINIRVLRLRSTEWKSSLNRGSNNFHTLSEKGVIREGEAFKRTVPPLVSTHTFCAPRNHLQARIQDFEMGGEFL